MVSWECLDEALVGYGFPSRFIQWIMVCITSTKFTVLMVKDMATLKANEDLDRDPVSPLLFVLEMEYVSRISKCMSLLPIFRFHLMCQQLHLTHLIFADDLMIFFKGEINSVARVKNLWSILVPLLY